MARATHRRDPFRDGQTTAVTVVEQAAVDLRYDYSALPDAYRDQVRQSALTIKPRLKRAAEDIFVIGRELRTIKDKLPHGEYTNWLDIEFGLSDRMAQRFMGVYERLGRKSDKLSVLAPSTLYLLAAPSTPDEVIKDVEEQIETGEHLSVSHVQRIIADAKQRAKAQRVTVIDGEFTRQKAVTAVSPDQLEKAKHLDKVLSQTIELLAGDSAEDWADLFHNSELSRVRNEIYRMREHLREAILEKETDGNS